VRLSIARIVRNIALKQLSALPTATGQIARHAYARARKAKIELAPLLEEAGLTRQQIEDQDSRIPGSERVHACIQALDGEDTAGSTLAAGNHLARGQALRSGKGLKVPPGWEGRPGDLLQFLVQLSRDSNQSFFAVHGRLVCLRGDALGRSWHAECRRRGFAPPASRVVRFRPWPPSLQEVMSEAARSLGTRRRCFVRANQQWMTFQRGLTGTSIHRSSTRTGYAP
jgi:hypothetical protein